MFQDRLFTPKYFLGWYPSSLVFFLVTKPTAAQDLVGILALSFGLSLTGLLFLGLIYGVAKIQNKTPIQWEIVWWCYPPISILVVLWSIFRAFARF
jgi:hypothetical protein